MSQTDEQSNAALLIMVHGSPTANANDPMYAVVDAVRRRNAYRIVEVGFLECNQPAIPEAIARCVRQGISRIDAVPYFLHVGAHVAEDLPGLLDDAREKYPDIMFRLGAFLGASPQAGAVLTDRALAAQRESGAER